MLPYKGEVKNRLIITLVHVQLDNADTGCISPSFVAKNYQEKKFALQFEWLKAMVLASAQNGKGPRYCVICWECK